MCVCARASFFLAEEEEKVYVCAMFMWIGSYEVDVDLANSLE